MRRRAGAQGPARSHDRTRGTVGVSRRRFIGQAGIATIGAAGVLAAPGLAGTPTRKRRKRQTVAVFGGGIAGLTAAHELIERGFDVTVYESRAWGGKARSTEVPHSARGGRRPLPGEHGYRFWFGFYQNTIDTFRRIAEGGSSTFDRLTAVPQFAFARDGGRGNLALGLAFGDDPKATTPEQVVDLIVALGLEAALPPDGAAWFGNRMGVFLSSCEARRMDDWEHQSWVDFMRADSYGENYRRILVKSLSEVVQASKAETTCARFPSLVLEWVIYNVLGRNSNGPVGRMLDRPTDEALFTPWLELLRDQGCRLHRGQRLEALDVRDSRIAGARLRDRRGASDVSADFYVCALPVERARRLWNPAVLRVDPSLARMRRLDTDWMNGLKFFLSEELPASQSFIVHCDSPWSVSAVAQAGLWGGDFASRYGDGQVRESLSTIISNWNTPGVLYGKTARECTPDEVAAEAWEQMKRHVNDDGEIVLADDMLHSYDIDPGMMLRNRRLVSRDPLVLPSVGQFADRPDVTTAIPNLFLCGDYLKSDWEVANMECASFNARRAANAVLDRSDSREEPCSVIGPYRPPEWEPAKKIDADRYRRGQPNLLDVGT